MMLVVEQNRDTVWSSSSRLVQIALNCWFFSFVFRRYDKQTLLGLEEDGTRGRVAQENNTLLDKINRFVCSSVALKTRTNSGRSRFDSDKISQLTLLIVNISTKSGIICMLPYENA